MLKLLKPFIWQYVVILQWVLQEFRLWICWQRGQKVRLPPLPLRSEELIFWQRHCPTSGPINMGWHSVDTSIKLFVHKLINMSISCMHLIKFNRNSKCDSWLNSHQGLNSVQSAQFCDFSDTIPHRKSKKTTKKYYTRFLLFGPPFSFWYKSSLFWKQKNKKADFRSKIMYSFVTLNKLFECSF